MTQFSKIFNGILLVAGTSIGGGMLALPVLTSLGGFQPSLVIYFACWLFMMCTGLLFIEISGWMEQEANIITMAQKTLGKYGKVLAWILYLFLFYCLTLAYLVGSGSLFAEFTAQRVSTFQGSLIFLVIFGPFVYLGPRVVGHLNGFLMLGLGLSFALFVFLGFEKVENKNLLHRDWNLSLFALPVAFTAFAYQGIVPTLLTYLDNNSKNARTAIIVGSFIPLLAYILWQWLILGIIPTYGEGGLEQALLKGQNAVQPLKNFIENPWIYLLGQAFAFFALVTSFFGVTLGLMDFLIDGLNLPKDAKSKGILCLLIFTPPLALSYIYPSVFLQALDFAGGFGCALLLGLLPILMVWSGRYIKKYENKEFSVPGGKLLLIFLFGFVLFELICEITGKCYR